MSFPFPYFGHAYSESVIVDVSVWFAGEPSSKDREHIGSQLGEDVTWSGAVANVNHIRGTSDKHDTRIPAAVKSASLKVYGVKRVEKPLMFGPHLVVDEALRRLHAKFPIVFAVREQGTKDRVTAWHEWSVKNRGLAFEHLEALLKRNPAPSVKREGFDWIAPWLRAATNVARACTTKSSLAFLEAGEKAAMGDLFLQVAEHAQVKSEWAENHAAHSDVTESHDTLTVLAEKLSGPRTPVEGARGLLAQIEKESLQFEFTKIKLSECPTYERIKADDSVRFEVAVLATEKQLRFLEKLSGNRPGVTSMAFGADDQQQLQVRERLIASLLRRKGTFGETDAVKMLEVLAGTIRPLGAWLPLELIAEKLREHAKTSGKSPRFTTALKKLLDAKYALERDEQRGWFERS
ncbi:MAG: hypothetical protein JNM17_17145 [Archangium sp.]|nr:hypothetical protein [Archangium sp.]